MLSCPVMTSSTSGHPWNQSEIDACVQAYLAMLDLEQRGEHYVKAQWNAQLRAGALAGRSVASVEMRMQNISAVLRSVGLPSIQGYVPLDKVGRTGTTAILTSLATYLMDFPVVFRPLPEVEVPPLGKEMPEKSIALTATFQRDDRVVAWVLRRAGGFCEHCELPAPFQTAVGRPFLEVHHVVPLASGGPDTLDNAAALCPNCHRAAHFSVESSTIRQRLQAKLQAETAE